MKKSSDDKELEGEESTKSELYLISPTSLPLSYPSTLKKLTILHSDILKEVPLIPSNLILLNLSGNSVKRIERLVESLVHIDLSVNEIEVIEGLQGLVNLEYLDLSGNRIQKMEGLKEIEGEEYSLKCLKLQGNEIFDLREIEIFSR